MNEDLKISINLLKDKKHLLPLVLYNLEPMKKESEISGKIIEIEKYRSKKYPIGFYYKNVTKVIE
jgi:hypothetical protein